MARLFTSAQLRPHVNGFERAWHKVRSALGVGWRAMQVDAIVEGVVDGGEAAEDGDTCFDVIAAVNIRYHCEVDPADLEARRPELARLEHGSRVRVYGACVCDLGHGTLEIHPVTRIEFL